MKATTVRLVSRDKADELYFRTMWRLADTLLVLGAAERAIDALLHLLTEALPRHVDTQGQAQSWPSSFSSASARVPP
jgi:hypothetical protein